MILNIFILFYISLLGSTEQSHIQLITKSKQYYENIFADTTGVGYILNYEQKVKYRDIYDQPETKETLHILFNNHKLRMDGAEFTLFSDTTFAILILNEQKSIQINNVAGRKRTPEHIKFFNTLFDSLIYWADIVDFSLEEKFANIKLHLNEKNIPPPFDGAEIKYIIDTTNFAIDYIQVIYNSKNIQIKEIEMKFLEQRVVLDDEFFNEPIGSNIFNPDGSLVQMYKDFKLISD